MRQSLVIVIAACASAVAAPAKVVPFQDAKIEGYASMNAQQFAETKLSGTVSALTSKSDNGFVKWELTVDAAGKPHVYKFNLPPKVTPQLKKGTAITVEAFLVGGGPNTRGQVSISDDQGPVLAIDHLPVDWTTERGKKLHTDKAGGYDETTYAVLLHAPKEPDPAELVAGWRAFKLAGHRFVGNGNAVERDLHGHLAPPDYVSGWTDFSVVRADP